MFKRINIVSNQLKIANEGTKTKLVLFTNITIPNIKNGKWRFNVTLQEDKIRIIGVYTKYKEANNPDLFENKVPLNKFVLLPNDYLSVKVFDPQEPDQFQLLSIPKATATETYLIYGIMENKEWVALCFDSPFPELFEDDEEEVLEEDDEE